MFSDQHHVERIREKLLSGNVSVMVGAGFSLNATQLSKSKGTFLTWPQLIDLLKSKLYIDEGERKYASTDPLKLAEEFEFEFGREALEDLLKKSLPDENYVPGDLHKMLLNLPWADIYTTNYDTLIERTTKYIYDKHYTVIQTVQDIPNSVKPRIIKLHGSFPSHRPFIFTKEDYRKYPKLFSPFVNMVQQSIMENTLCLIGFSGEDPNFKNWIGWVKDNLGDYASSIYFCGFLNDSQKRRLESNKIKVINFSELFNTSDQKQNHINALTWFFLELLKPKPFIAYQWPEVNQYNPLSDWKVTEIVKEKLSYSSGNSKQHTVQDLYIYKDNSIRPNVKELTDIANQWKEERERYSQWVVAPRRARNYIWHNIDSTFIDLLAKQKESISYKEWVTILFELSWRLETGLLSLSIPRFSPLINVFEEVVYKYLDFRNKKKLKETLQINEEEIDDIESKLVYLSFTLINYYRESYSIKKTYEILTELKDLIFKNAESIAEYYYQQCLLELGLFNYPKVEDLLEQWPINKNSPYWEVRRASILIELRYFDKAETTLQSALNEIRERNLQGNDLELLSQESWILRILATIKGRTHYRNLYNNVEREEFARVVNCDAGLIYEEVITGVDRSLIRQQKKPKISFDPGREINSITFNNNYDDNIKNSLQIIKMVEKTGHRFKIKNTVFDKDRIFTACEYLTHEQFAISLSILVQLENKDYIKSFLSRETLAVLNSEIVDTLFDNIFESISYLNGLRIKEQIDVFYDSRLTILLEILSRLTIRLNEKQLNKCLHLAIDIYKSLPTSRNIHTFGKELNSLFERVLFAYDMNEVSEKLSEFLKLPLIEDQSVRDPIFYILNNTSINSKDTEIEEIDPWIIESLINKLENNLGKNKFNILSRLIVCKTILTKKQKTKIGSILSKNNFNDTGFYLNTIIEEFLSTDNTFNKEILNEVKKIIEQDFNNVYGEEEGRKFSYSSSSVNNLEEKFIELTRLLKDEKKCINYSAFQESIRKMIKNLKKWWDNNKKYLINSSNIWSFSWVIYKRFINALLYVIPADNEMIHKVYSIADDLTVIKIQVSCLYPISLYKNLVNLETVEELLIENLHSLEKERVFDALEAIVNWTDILDEKLSSKIPDEIINELIQKVFLRRSPYLDQSINVLIRLTKSKAFNFNSKQLEKLLDSLKNLYDETNLTNFTEDNFGTLAESELLPIRALATELAYKLYNRIRIENTSIPKILILWKEESQKSAIPEIKKAWKDY